MIIDQLQNMDVSLLIHPLVLINIGDHLTRTRVSTPASSPLPPIAGALLGTIHSQSLEIHTSFDLPFLPGGPVDVAYFDDKATALKQVMPDFVCLGWYHYCADQNVDTPPPFYPDVIIIQR